MSQIINTNIMSLNAQRNLGNSQGALAQSLERLSSGLRINSAKDDAAGLAISERFTTQIRGLNQAVRNANDGISLAQTGEGALQEVQNNLQRIRELAVQSANATNSDSDREAINREVQQRLQEIDRIADQTSFNGQKILDGSFGDAKFQVGANVGETIDLSLESSTRLNAIGALATAEVDLSDFITEGTDATPGTYTTGDVTALLGEDLSAAEVGGSIGLEFANTDFDSENVTFEVDGTEVTLDADYADFEALAAAIEGQLTGYTVTDEGGGNITITNDESIDAVAVTDVSGDGAGDVTVGTSEEGSYGTVSFEVDGNAVTLDSADGYATLDDMAAAIQDQLGGDYVVSATDDGIEIATADTGDGVDAPVISDASSFSSALFDDGTSEAGEDGEEGDTFTVDGDFGIRFGDDEDGTVINVADGEYSDKQELADAISAAIGNNGRVTLDDDGNMSIISPNSITFSGTQGEAMFGADTVEADGDLSDVDVLTVANANNVIERVDSALTAVSDIRSDFGAIQNRFESTISNLTQTSENLEESRSRIRDADFATETAELTRAQILQQAGTSVLSQANAVPQNALAL
ncbi:flagellin, partial [Thioalkalivibrio sp. ALJ3]|uniref:flagellin N-terminal helical domain-containing protein n=1 Tax=Thioalkalivibrio sp. ALJ3 TaxID=1240557 RepID=UPI00037B780B